MNERLEALALAACTPVPVSPAGFNAHARIPYGCTVDHLSLAMTDFIEFLTVVNIALHSRHMARLESPLMPANFSSVVSEFMNVAIPKYCAGLVKNIYHNGHPDLIPTGRFAGDAVQYAHEGIEVKASRYISGWQGHNAEESWLMVFVFEGNKPADLLTGDSPHPFRFVKVVGESLTLADWKFSGRSETSRRTITATVTPAGCARMEANWIYRGPELSTSNPANNPGDSRNA